MMKLKLPVIGCLFCLLVLPLAAQQNWKAGMARTVITPQQPVWQAGYAVRNKPADGVLHDLWAKALVLEDANSNKSLIITMDVLGLPKDVSDELREQIEKKYGLKRSQIVLSASHTHSGPVLSRGLFTIYPMPETEWKKVDCYTLAFKERILAMVDQAMKKTEPAKVYTQKGVTRFQVNRRQNNESKLKSTDSPLGPNDYTVPVVKITDLQNNTKALLFGYACHPTTLSIYHYSGDYPGFAQLELEKRYPGLQAMFFQGCGADQNPMPRRAISYARQYGEELAAAVVRVLTDSMTQQKPLLKTAYAEVPLAFDTPPAREELEKVMQDKTGTYEAVWASYLLNERKAGRPLETSYPYPVQALRMGDQLMITLGGEVVVQYSLHLKKLFGENTIVMGYANDVMAYIPTARILREGGYEGDTSMRVYAHPSKWAGSIEDEIVNCAAALGRELGIVANPDQVEFTQ